jgi:pyrroline-5-carboxylate reductase
MAEDKLRGTVLLVGAGKMGGALLEGWLARGLDPADIAVLDPSPPAAVAQFLSARKILREPDPKTFAADAVFFALKPQMAAAAAPLLVPFVKPKTVVISIMAGRTIASLEGTFPAAAVVRAMPNTPAAIGRGITVAIGNGRLNAAGKALAHDLLAAVGSVEWVGDERLMDAVTAVSGSGPAYVFLLAESLAEAGVAAGLSPELARKLARETIAGAGELLHRSPLDPADLRENVTSPGGTTAAALEVLMGKEGFQTLMAKAIAAATKRSRDLAN